MRIITELETTSDLGTPMKSGFWKRQFLQPATNPQVVFDLIFGVAGPIVAFIFDPIVFRSGFAGPPLFPAYQTFVYLFSGFEIVLLCLWLVKGAGSELSNAMIGGALLSGGLICLVIGCVLAPFSLLGLMFGIGLFGFLPFVTAIVYLRNGCRALRSNHGSNFNLAVGLASGSVLVLTIAAVLALQIRTAAAKSVDDIMHADPTRASHAAHRLAVLRFFASADLDRIVQAYISETDAQRKEILKKSYQEITGEDIELRVRILQD